VDDQAGPADDTQGTDRDTPEDGEDGTKGDKGDPNGPHQFGHRTSLLQVIDSIEDDDEDINDNKAILDNDDDDSNDSPPVISNKHVEALYSQDNRPSEDIRKEIEEKKALEQEIAARNQFQVCHSLSFSLLLLSYYDALW
jgi:hypothetical protein